MRKTLASLLLLAACHQPTQTTFSSAPPPGGGGAQRGGVDNAVGGTTTPTAAPASSTRTVEETDLYRLEGTRLYYLNSYRGLMVFDVSDVDHPALLGRSAIYGDPVDMIVRNGVAIVVVGDWYGRMDDGTPFHGSIVRGLDASDPTNIKVLGEAKLGGWVRDDRVVGDVIYAVSEDYGWTYGWDAFGAIGASSTSGPSVVVTSVSFANNTITQVASKAYVGYSGIFNVTPNAIMLAHNAALTATGYATQTELRYLDISDPAGAIVERGALTVDGLAQGWGADNGRWNLDFADGKTAHVVGCSAGSYGYCDGTGGYVLSIADFSNPDMPALKSSLPIAATGWSVAARFDVGRLYLSPSSGWYGSSNTTPFQVYDLSDPTAPFLAGSTAITGVVWNILPAPSERIFALGNDWGTSTSYSDVVSLKYLDVSDASQPAQLGNAQFGQGWAWTPAAGTFKAFTMDATKGLVVLPFSGWNDATQQYTNGLQLIQFTPTSITTAGAAHTRGWVERGIFVGNRLVSLSDLSLAVVDYSNTSAPSVIAELTLARNVVASKPSAKTIAEISSDWWDNDVSTSEVRVLPLANAEEAADSASAVSVTLDGVNARVFQNGDLDYIVTNVRVPYPCPTGGSGCYGRAQQIQVVDLSNGSAVLRGKIQLPVDNWGWYGWGWYGCFWWDWWGGSETVQVGGDALAFRRWEPVWGADGAFLDENSLLYVVDLSNPDAPNIASATITTDPNGWWGNMQVVGSTLYTQHYDWIAPSVAGTPGTVAYYLDRIDLSDRQHPVVGDKINVPGFLVGGNDSDPSILYTIDYNWTGTITTNSFDVVKVNGNSATLLSRLSLDGWVGSTFIRGNHAYLSTQTYDNTTGPSMRLHDIDIANSGAISDNAVVASDHGWGWLLDVQGDRALITSGWGWDGLDIYQLSDGKAPVYKQFARTRGWWINSAARQDASLYLSSGYWGVQKIDLQ